MPMRPGKKLFEVVLNAHQLNKHNSSAYTRERDSLSNEISSLFMFFEEEDFKVVSCVCETM